mmetsp:Transcript_21501/g.50049  ORF Transcript_21501/g.50049 Transcript_21501/m.50049 type:complete len:287 (-) Transcript_21501:1217-2077(-)
MQRLDVFQSGHQQARGVLLGRLVLFQGCIQVRLGTLFVGECLAVLHPFRCRVLHHLLVVSLRILLLCLCLGHLLVEVLDEQVDHGNHASSLLRLLRVCIPRLRWRSRSVLALPVRCHLCKGDSCAGDATSRSRGDVAAEAGVRSVPGRELNLGRSFVQLRVVELIQSVLGKAEQFLGGRVRGHELFVFSVLLFPVLCCLGDGLVQLSDPCLKCGNGLFQALNVLPQSGNCRLLVRDAALQGLLLVIGSVKLSSAVLLLVAIVHLLLLQHLHHFINHLNDLLEATLA